MTWALLIRLEPRLGALYEQAKAIKDEGRGSFCANDAWYGRGGYDGLKEMLCDLIGWRVRRCGADPRLCTSESYDIAYHTIYDALPNCRNCQCIAWDSVIAQTLTQRRQGKTKPWRS